jgi:hypothetical protein
VTDWAKVPVAAIAGGAYPSIEEIVHRITEGRAPVGFGQLLGRYAEDACVRWDVCLAVALKETGKFKYGGTDPVFSVDPSYNNFGGLKTTDSTASYRFATVSRGVIGLVAHVAWYAHMQHVIEWCDLLHDPRHFAGGHTGRLKTPADFGNGVWNTGTTYAPSIIKLLGEIWTFV